MENFWNISIGETLTVLIALLALIAATLIGIRQNLINKRLLNLQDSVELYIVGDAVTVIDASGETPNNMLPAIIIRNLSTKMIYLNNYNYNGAVYPTHDHILPPISQLSDACYHIYLPTNDLTHISFQIFFTDWSNNKWETSGYADFVNRQWKVTYTPCKKAGKE